MQIIPIHGNILNCPPNMSIAHCVSVDGKMGAGIAKTLQNVFSLRKQFLGAHREIGYVVALRRGPRYLIQLVTKEWYFHLPTIMDFELSIVNLRRFLEFNQITELAIPQLGSGLDKLNPDDVLEVLERVLAGLPVTLMGVQRRDLIMDLPIIPLAKMCRYILCLLVLHQVIASKSPIVITETKGVQINLADSKVAMGTLQIDFKVNLPSVNFDVNLNDSVCTPNLSQTIRKACTTLVEIDRMSLKILLELQNVFESTENLSLLRHTRNKRALIPLLGRVLNWITGLATEAELNKIVNKVNDLAYVANSLVVSHNNFIQSTEENFEKLREHQSNLEDRMKDFVNKFNNIVDVVGRRIIPEMDVLSLKTAGTASIFNKINLLQTHLIALKSIYDNCKSNKLPKIAVSEERLKETLLKNSKKMDEYGMDLLFGIESIHSYYEMESTVCKLLNNDTLLITTEIPLRDAKTNFHVMEIRPVKFLLEGRTCQIVEKLVRVATDGIVVKELSNSHASELDVYMLPRHNSDSELSNCIHKLLTNSNIVNIADSCALHCTETHESTVQLLSSNKYSVLNPGSALSVICTNNIVEDIERNDNGRVEVYLPCTCSLQETTGSRKVLVEAVRTCNINLRNSNDTVVINLDWASEDFHPAQLFATGEDFERMKMHNISIPQLSLTKVEKFKSSLTNWKNIPTFGSGWFEIFLWVFIFCILVLIGYLYLRSRFAWLAFDVCWKRQTDLPQPPVTLRRSINFNAGRRPTVNPRRHKTDNTNESAVI